MQQEDIETSSSDIQETLLKQSSSATTTIRHRTAGQHHPPQPATHNQDTKPSSKKIRSSKWGAIITLERIIVVVLLAVILILVNKNREDDDIPNSIKKKNQYKGEDFWNPDMTLSTKTLYESPFARFQVHKVKAGKHVFNDWLWCDEMDHINVVVQEAETGKFVIFRQTKYANPGPPLLAVVGGFLEPGEEPIDTAKRELLEELQMESNEWVSLGKYRAAVNRGGGYTHTFLAKNAVKVVDKNREVVGQADLEKQDILRCSEEELLQYALDGKFGEVKWVATVALSLLRIRS